MLLKALGITSGVSSDFGPEMSKFKLGRTVSFMVKLSRLSLNYVILSKKNSEFGLYTI